MKAIMSEKLRNILNHPQKAQELQKQLSVTGRSSKVEKHKAPSPQKVTLKRAKNESSAQNPNR